MKVDLKHDYHQIPVYPYNEHLYAVIVVWSELFVSAKHVWAVSHEL